MASLTSSRKAKGRRLQQEVRNDLRVLTKPYGLEDADFESTSMGVSGVDVILSPAAKRLIPVVVECKNVEALNVVGVFQKHYLKYREALGYKLLIHKRNRTSTMVTLHWADLLELFGELLSYRQGTNKSKEKSDTATSLQK